jgi:hypothetical protein
VSSKFRRRRFPLQPSLPTNGTFQRPRLSSPADIRKPGAIERIDYPFDRAEGSPTVAQYLVKLIPLEDAIGVVFESAGDLLKSLISFYARAVEWLCLSAEAVEEALGCQPLPQPDPAAAPAGELHWSGPIPRAVA